MDKGVIRIKRTGSGMQDTSYALAATTRTDTIPDEAESASLVTIKEYFKGRYGGFSPNGNGHTEASVVATAKSLF